MKSRQQYQVSHSNDNYSNKSVEEDAHPIASAVETNTSDKLADISHQDVVCAGKHIIIDFWGAKYLQDINVIEQALKTAAEIAGAVLLHIHLHKFSGEGGVTGVALLAESHISIHTWPEHDYAAFDIFMCGDSKPEKSVEILKNVFKPKKINHSLLLRGQLEPSLKC